MFDPFCPPIYLIEIKKSQSQACFSQQHLWDHTNKMCGLLVKKNNLVSQDSSSSLFLSLVSLQNHSIAVFHYHCCFGHHLHCHSKYWRSLPPLAIVVFEAIAVRLPKWGDTDYIAVLHPPPNQHDWPPLCCRLWWLMLVRRNDNGWTSRKEGAVGMEVAVVPLRRLWTSIGSGSRFLFVCFLYFHSSAEYVWIHLFWLACF